jgi:hypothetical protein
MRITSIVTFSMVFNQISQMLVGVPAYWFGDSPVSYQLGFQDPATTTMEGIYLFNLLIVCDYRYCAISRMAYLCYIS